MYIADLHIHSKYSRATSGECVPELLELWGRRKGIDLIGTGDFTHPAWRAQLREKLIPAGDGLYRLRDDCRVADETGGNARPRFVVTGEISSIYKKDGRVRKVHNVFLLPSLEAADELAHRLEAVGNVHSDGRPILGVDSRDLFELALDACPQAILIPAHIWTPHFSLFGAFSGFDTIEACYGDLTPYIHALETGLSSDPPMNWRLSALDGYRLVSNSDAHSPAKLGREANLFDTDLTYPALSRALETGEGFLGTIEFFPEEGKYHLDGHRGCGLRLTPEQTREAGGICPVCGKKITVGVLSRVEQLADRPEGYRPAGAAPFESLIPLAEVIAASTGYTAASARVRAQYDALLREVGNEFYILREAPAGDIERAAGPCVAEGIRRMRSGRVELAPGFDGEYGKIRLLGDDEIESLSGQLCLFGAAPKKKKRTAKTSRSAAHTASKKEKAAAPSPAAGGALYGLNEEQRFAASAIEPAVAVVAGPGTGKTKTLISRIAWLIEQCGVSPAEITAVTFTNKAAGEMRQRLELLFGGREPAVPVRALTVGTFHAICLRLLEEAGMAAPVIDEFEAQSVAEDVLRGLELRLSARRLLEAASRVKNGFDGGSIPPEALQRYNDRLRELGVLDFDDILLRALELFERPDAPLPRERFTHLLVDEIQDINDVQYRLIRAWGRESAGVFVIGDPDQSIYGFRGANARCFERFLSDYEGARLVRLTRNYRSTPEILSCALSVLPRGGERELRAQREGGARVALFEPRDELAEGIFIAKEIGRLVGGIDMLDADAQQPRDDGAAVGFSDIAVLYRTHRQAEILEMCLRKESIPYVAAGRDKLLADDLVRGAAGFFRSLLDPDDAVSLRTCLCRVFGCAEEVIRRLPECGENERDALVRSDLGLRRWAELAQKYAPRLSGEKPRALLEEWAADCGYTQSPALEGLLNMAVFDGSMAGFLENLTLGQEGDVARSGNRVYSADTVSLMTLHGSKGLEFPVVFLCGVRQGVIPLDGPGRFCDPEEERRLLYVGMTRAQSELYVLSGTEPSPFLSALPEQCLRRGDTGAPAQAAWRGKQLSLFD